MDAVQLIRVLFELRDCLGSSWPMQHLINPIIAADEFLLTHKRVSSIHRSIA